MKKFILLNIIGLMLIFLYVVYVVNTAFDRVHPKMNNLYVKESSLGGKYGRGVFTLSDIKEGELIEITPYVEDDNNKFIGEIRDYVFVKGNSDPKTAERGIVAFGFASLCNHMDDPNARWFIEDKYLFVKALKPIKKDEEIFVSYGPGYWDTRKINKVE